jgi:predicted esterase
VTRALSIATATHGRVLIDEPDGRPAGLLVSLHGYGQSADDALAAAQAIPGATRWRIVAPQALHRFYTRGDRAVVASWMTRQDRDDAVADNVAYLDAAVGVAFGDLGAAGLATAPPGVFIGFSQGASMAYRAAVLGRHAAAGVIALGGDIPPEVRAAGSGRPWPPVLIGCGAEDEWYRARVDADVEFLQASGVRHEVVRFAGGHEWTAAFRERAGQWISER